MAPITLVEEGLASGQAASDNAGNTIVIVGMGCRLPGDVRDASGLWDLLVSKGTGYREFGDHRFELENFYHPNPDRPGSV
ncbi:hypothetical protein F5B17DRAFT_434520 [Nemania serpens]|nr:hypothetical protein F5B17DRAFT_434520 [Nemania serpens]